jgi:predicted amidohydrolase YtcJ
MLLQNAEPVKSLLKAGIPVALGSDGPLNPYLNIMFACMHPFRPSEALTVEEAVIAYTKTSAYAEMQDNKGMLAVGQLADLAVLSKDIFTIPLQQLPSTHSLLTMVNGKIILNQLEK